jgi:hypothetical protein
MSIQVPAKSENFIVTPEFELLVGISGKMLQEGKTANTLLLGPAGCGKTRTAEQLAAYLDLPYLHINCSSIREASMLFGTREVKDGQTYTRPSLFTQTIEKGGAVIMLDEMSKANKLLQVIFTRLTLEHSVGDSKLPAGSIVFVTGNNSSDGVGDTLSAHVLNRLCVINVRKPDARRWNLWATDNGISRIIRTWVAMNPSCLASYLDGGQEQNPYIFDPAKPITSFVTPRSLVGANEVVNNSGKLGQYVTKAALAGLCGGAFAESVDAFMKMEKEWLKVADILADPENIAIPTNPAVLFHAMFNAVDTIDTQDELTSFMKFVKRLKSEEIQACFNSMVFESKRTAKLARNNDELRAWGMKNIELLI